MAWSDSSASSLWSPPHGHIKSNYDIAMQPGFAVAATVLNNSNGGIIKAASKQLFTCDVAIEEANATLPVVVHSLMVEGDPISITLAIQQPNQFATWNSSCYFLIFICFLSLVGKP